MWASHERGMLTTQQPLHYRGYDDIASVMPYTHLSIFLFIHFYRYYYMADLSVLSAFVKDGASDDDAGVRYLYSQLKMN